jgi:hypothetical protein
MYPKVYEIHITWHYKLDTLIQKPNNYGKEIERPEKR